MFPTKSVPKARPVSHDNTRAMINTINTLVMTVGTMGLLAAEDVAGAGGEDEGAAADAAPAVEAAATDEAGAAEVTAANGTKVTGFTTHGVDRAVGEGASGAPGVRAGTRPEAILDALRSPKSVQTGVDSQGRPFQIFTGQNARVVVNPESGKIVSVNPTSAAGAH
jgi:hypothetical protein